MTKLDPGDRKVLPSSWVSSPGHQRTRMQSASPEQASRRREAGAGPAPEDRRTELLSPEKRVWLLQQLWFSPRACFFPTPAPQYLTEWLSLKVRGQQGPPEPVPTAWQVFLDSRSLTRMFAFHMDYGPGCLQVGSPLNSSLAPAQRCYTICAYVCVRFIDSLVDKMVTQMEKHVPAMQETWVQSLGQEDPLEKGMATHSSILAWRIP